MSSLSSFGSRHDMRTYQNFIGGEWTPAESGQTCRNVNPADTREVVAEYASSGKEDAVAAIEAARKAFAGSRHCWSKMPSKVNTPWSSLTRPTYSKTAAHSKRCAFCSTSKWPTIPP